MTPDPCHHVPAVTARGVVRCERCGVPYHPAPDLAAAAERHRAVIDAALRDYACGACTADDVYQRLREVTR